MRVGGERPKLEHVAEDRDPPSPGGPEHRERGGDGGGARVVGVVDDHEIFGPTHAHPVRRRVHRRERDRGLVQRDAELGRGTDRGERGRNEMAARDRRAHVGGLRAATRDEAQAVEPGRSDVGRAKLGIGGLAIEHDARLVPGARLRTRGSSAFSKARPSAGSDAISSAFPAAMASTLGVREKWTGRSGMAVMTPIRGRTRLQRSAISPGT